MGRDKASLFLLICLLAAFVFPLHAAAQNYDAIGGAEWDSHGQSFTYLGGGFSRPIDGDISITGRVFAGYLKYKFESSGKTLTAQTPIVTPSVGLKLNRTWCTLAGSVGPDFRRIKKDLVSGGTETKSETGAFAQAEAYMWGSEKKSAELIANYSTVDSFIWARGRIKKGLFVIGKNTDFKIGAEAVRMGNSDFSATQIGLLAEFFDVASNLSVILKGGYKNSTAFSSGTYGGVELYYGF